MTALARTLTFALDIVLPPRCIQCAAPTGSAHALCPECWGAITFLEPPACDGCGLPFAYDEGAGTLCLGCAAERPRFDRARAAMAYDEHSRRVVLALKHGDRHHGLPAFGRWLARAGAPLLPEADLIVPVPLHWTRLFARRYNQAALLAYAVAKAWRQSHGAAPIVAPDLLRRRRRTASQGHLTRIQRAQNVAGAFRVRPGAAIAGKRVLLIDDVLTTGATVEACARVLKRAGASGVDVLTLARAMKSR